MRNEATRTYRLSPPGRRASTTCLHVHTNLSGSCSMTWRGRPEKPGPAAALARAPHQPQPLTGRDFATWVRLALESLGKRTQVRELPPDPITTGLGPAPRRRGAETAGARRWSRCRWRGPPATRLVPRRPNPLVEVWEKQGDFAGGRLGAVRTVHQVLGRLERQITPDGAGAATAGLVAPIRVRTTCQVSSGPSTTSKITGQRVMKASKSSKKLFPACSA